MKICITSRDLGDGLRKKYSFELKQHYWPPVIVDIRRVQGEGSIPVYDGRMEIRAVDIGFFRSFLEERAQEGGYVTVTAKGDRRPVPFPKNRKITEVYAVLDWVEELLAEQLV